MFVILKLNLNDISYTNSFKTASEKNYMDNYIEIHVVKHRFVKKDKIQIWSDWYRKIINYKTSKRENQNIMENE